MRGLGSDLIEIERVRASIKRRGLHLLNRLFSKREQDYCYRFKDPVLHFAGRFAAKEAVAKALGTGFGAQLSWQDLEILNDPLGKPAVHFSEPAIQQFQHPKVLLTLSHSATHAMAVAIWE